jgi:hypothetical protein
VAKTVIEAVDESLNRSSLPGQYIVMSPATIIAFTRLVKNVLLRAGIGMPVVLVALVYIKRASPRLHIVSERWANERVFLGSLILAHKVSNS